MFCARIIDEMMSGICASDVTYAGRPSDLSTESSEGLDEDSSLDGPKGRNASDLTQAQKVVKNVHVEASSDASTLQGLVGRVLLSIESIRRVSRLYVHRKAPSA